MCVYRSNIEGLQDKVSVVKTQMQHNLDSAMRRGDELDHLQTQAGKWAGLMATPLFATPLLDMTDIRCLLLITSNVFLNK